jgi:hypothetical protein
LFILTGAAACSLLWSCVWQRRRRHTDGDVRDGAPDASAVKSKAQREVHNQLEKRFDILNAKSEHFLFEMEK